MPSFTKAAFEKALPETLDEAIKEINRLRKALIQANDKCGNLFERLELQKRSHKGDVKHYRELLGLE